MTTNILTNVISSLLEGLPVNREEIQNALLSASVALDNALVNNQPTRQIEADRESLLWLLSKL